MSRQVIRLNQSLQVGLNHYRLGQPAESSLRRIRWFFPLSYSAANSAKTRLNTDSHRVESTNMFHVQRDVQTPITTSINTFVGRWRSAVEATVSTSFLRMG